MCELIFYFTQRSTGQSHTHFMFRKVLPFYVVCELLCLNVENYIVRF